MSISTAITPSFLRTKLRFVRRSLLGLPIVPLRVVITVPAINFVSHVSEKSKKQWLAKSLTRQQKLASVKPTPIKSTTKVITTQTPSWSKRWVNGLATAAIVVSVVVGLVLAAPKLYYLIVPVDTAPVQALESGTVLGGEFAEGTETAEPEEEKYLPPQDPNLPQGKWLIIPRIGVRTELQETDDVEAALQKGVWQAPGYGQPGDTEQPVIAAAHRYGWEWWWKSDYWKYHSFYLLPDTQPGDIVEIIDDQRKWTYEIYGGEEGGDITDYSADLILYTCKFLNSPVRHFRYARLVDPTADTQS